LDGLFRELMKRICVRKKTDEDPDFQPGSQTSQTSSENSESEDNKDNTVSPITNVQGQIVGFRKGSPTPTRSGQHHRKWSDARRARFNLRRQQRLAQDRQQSAGDIPPVPDSAHSTTEDVTVEPRDSESEALDLRVESTREEIPPSMDRGDTGATRDDPSTTLGARETQVASVSGRRSVQNNREESNTRGGAGTPWPPQRSGGLVGPTPVLPQTAAASFRRPGQFAPAVVEVSMFLPYIEVARAHVHDEAIRQLLLNVQHHLTELVYQHRRNQEIAIEEERRRHQEEAIRAHRERYPVTLQLVPNAHVQGEGRFSRTTEERRQPSGGDGNNTDQPIGVHRALAYAARPRNEGGARHATVNGIPGAENYPLMNNFQ